MSEAMREVAESHAVSSGTVRVRGLGAPATLSLFAGWGCVSYAATRPGMAWLVGLGVRPDLSWFLAGSVVFLGLLLTATVALRYDGHAAVREALVDRCRFRRMTRREWRWAIGATVGMALLTVATKWILQRALAGFTPQPPFFHMGALAPNELWVLLAWLPSFSLNIVGEELLWHGYLLPRNEVRFGRHAWIVNGLGWWLFHFPFGPYLVLLLLPVIAIETWAVQRSGNTWVGVIVHAALNGPAFVAIALGLA